VQSDWGATILQIWQNPFRSPASRQSLLSKYTSAFSERQLFLLDEPNEFLRSIWKSYIFSFGTSSDRIGSPSGTQSYFLTGSKHLWRLPLSVYASLNYSEWDIECRFHFTAYRLFFIHTATPPFRRTESPH